MKTDSDSCLLCALTKNNGQMWRCSIFNYLFIFFVVDFFSMSIAAMSWFVYHFNCISRVKLQFIYVRCIQFNRCISKIFFVMLSPVIQFFQKWTFFFAAQFYIDIDATFYSRNGKVISMEQHLYSQRLTDR